MTDKDRTALGLGDQKGTERAELKATKDGPGLALSDKDGKPIWRAPSVVALDGVTVSPVEHSQSPAAFDAALDKRKRKTE